MGTLKFYYGQSVFKPVYNTLDREIGELSLISDSNGKAISAYIVSQQDMTEGQSKLFFYFWKRRKKMSFDETVKYAIKLSTKVSAISDPEKAISLLEEESRMIEDAKLDRYIQRMIKRIR